METSESDSEPASACQGSDCETDPRPKLSLSGQSIGKGYGTDVYQTKFNRA